MNHEKNEWSDLRQLKSRLLARTVRRGLSILIFFAVGIISVLWANGFLGLEISPENKPLVTIISAIVFVSSLIFFVQNVYKTKHNWEDYEEEKDRIRKEFEVVNKRANKGTNNGVPRYPPEGF